MHIAYVPLGEEVWLMNLLQSGHGGFVGQRFQRGYGLGSLFSSMLRSILPLARKVGKKVAKQALKTGVLVADDIAHGADLDESLKMRGKSSVAQLAAEALRAMQRNQKGSGVGVRPRGPAKGIKRVRNKPTTNKKKKKRRQDTLGFY